MLSVLISAFFISSEDDIFLRWLPLQGADGRRLAKFELFSKIVGEKGDICSSYRDLDNMERTMILS